MATGHIQTLTAHGNLLPPLWWGEASEKATPAAPQPGVCRPDCDKVTQYAIELGRERLYPALRNPDYYVLTQRRRYFAEWLRHIPGDALSVLDVGGRIQPYKPLLASRIAGYIAIDPVPTGLVDAVARGESLPFRDGSFDVAICSQVLCYADDPQEIIKEIFRVLRPGGALLVSAPAVFPSHSERDKWRFMPGRMLSLLRDFSSVEVSPEGYSIGGIFRILATYFEFYLLSRFGQWLAHSILVPLANLAATYLDRYSNGDTRFTTNYCAFARK